LVDNWISLRQPVTTGRLDQPTRLNTVTVRDCRVYVLYSTTVKLRRVPINRTPTVDVCVQCKVDGDHKTPVYAM